MVHFISCARIKINNKNDKTCITARKLVWPVFLPSPHTLWISALLQERPGIPKIPCSSDILWLVRTLRKFYCELGPVLLP